VRNLKRMCDKYIVYKMWAKLLKQEQVVEEEIEAVREPETPQFESDIESLTDEEEYEDISYSKKTLSEIMKAFKNDESLLETFGWDGYKNMSVFAEEAIKRFRLKKLKSLNDRAYYFDNVYYYIWQYYKDDNGDEHLMRPNDDICKKLRSLNEIRWEPFFVQPDEFW
jgi:hypothetical protein